MIKIEYEMLGLRMDSNIDDKTSFVENINGNGEERRRINMKKMKLGVALLATVLLLGIPVSTAGASEVTGTTDVHEEIQMQAAEGESVQVPEQLTFGNVTVVRASQVITPSGDEWNYDSSTNTLHVTKTMTIEAGTIEKLIRSTGDLHITVARGVTLTVKNTYSSDDRCVIYAAGKITLDGEGTIDIEHDADGRGIKAEKSITIQGDYFEYFDRRKSAGNLCKR